MKNIFFVSVFLIFTGIIYLAIEGSEMQEIEMVIEISASPSRVWSIITDIDKWHEWSPIINSSQGNASVNSKLNITMMGKEDGMDGPTYKPVIIALDEPNLFRWRAHMLAGFVFTNDKIFKLESIETGTRLTHIETFKGLLAPIFCSQMEKGVPPMLNSMNRALKELAEN